MLGWILKSWVRQYITLDTTFWLGSPSLLIMCCNKTWNKDTIIRSQSLSITKDLLYNYCFLFLHRWLPDLRSNLIWDLTSNHYSHITCSCSGWLARSLFSVVTAFILLVSTVSLATSLTASIKLAYDSFNLSSNIQAANSWRRLREQPDVSWSNVDSGCLANGRSLTPILSKSSTNRSQSVSERVGYDIWSVRSLKD